MFKSKSLIALTASFVLGSLTLNVLTANSQETKADSSDHHYFHKAEKATTAEWGYEGKIGPDHWAEISPEFQLAASGKRQSPIDLADMTGKELPSIEFDYKSCKIQLVYNGHTIEEVEEAGSTITVAGKSYELKQFHFHSPSEHTLNGRHFEMEMHLVHKSEEGEIAVIGVFIDEGRENRALAPVWENLPTDENRSRSSGGQINIDDALPQNRDYYAYSGSLTTPPCTEDVKWMILSRPIELSKGQINKFRETIHGNNRPTQPLNGREVFDFSK